MTKEERKKYNKEYYKANTEKIKEREKEYRKANDEKRKEYLKANTEKIKKRKKEYYKANTEKIKEYLKANADKVNEWRKKYYTNIILKELPNSYIISQLKKSKDIDKSDITEDQIELRRLIIKLKRELKTI